MNRREGEDGNGAGVFIRRYWQIIVFGGGLIAAGAAGQSAIAENAKDISALQKRIETKLDQMQAKAEEQARINGKIEAYLENLMRERDRRVSDGR